MGAVPGVVLGALLFRAVSADGLRLLVGGIALGFVAVIPVATYPFMKRITWGPQAASCCAPPVLSR